MTSTFLVTPRRGLVMGAKLVTAVAFGAGCWAITTVVEAVVTPAFLAVHQLPGQAFGSSVVVRAIVMGLLAFVLWALFGLGLGAVLRNQAVATAAAIGIYAGGFAVVVLVVHLLESAFHAPWVLGLAVLAPAQASNVMIAPGRAFPGAPPCWAGALVLAGYGVSLAGFGAAVIRRRDVP